MPRDSGQARWAAASAQCFAVRVPKHRGDLRAAGPQGRGPDADSPVPQCGGGGAAIATPLGGTQVGPCAVGVGSRRLSRSASGAVDRGTASPKHGG